MRRTICGTDSERNVREKVRAARCRRGARCILVEDGELPPTVLPDRFDEGQRTGPLRSAPPSPQHSRFRYCCHAGRSGTRSIANVPPGLMTRATDCSVAARSASAGQGLQDPVRRHDERERPGARTAAADVAADEAGAPPCFDRRRRRRARASIGADRSTPTRRTPVVATGSSTRPVPHPSSSTGPPARCASRVQNATSALPMRPGVLPIIEGRITVPPGRPVCNRA